MRVALFITCFNDTLFPETGKATVEVLERLGVEVDFPFAQTCCGQMHFNTGYQREAIPLVRRFVEVFGGYDAVVAPSGSCVSMVRELYPMAADLAGDGHLAEKVEELGPKVFELSEFLVKQLGVTDVGAYYPHRVTYHPTCHSLRMFRVGDAPLELLRSVRGIDLVGVVRGRGVLRVRWNLRDQERGHLCRDALGQDPARPRHRGRGLHGRGQLVPDAHRRRTQPISRGGTDRASRPDTRQPNRGGVMAASSRTRFPLARPRPSKQSAKKSLSDSQLRRNLGKATQTIRRKRAVAVEEMPDWEGLREAGRAIKERVVRHLDEYLQQLEESVTRAGGEVHWARDAEEANRIISGIIKDKGAEEVVKVKSIATDETKLNEHLEKEGIKAFETDLAELIIQFAGET